MVETPVVDPPTGKQQQDPTALTTEKVQREVDNAISLLRAEFSGEIKNLITRLDAMDKALGKVEEYPTDMDIALGRQREYFEQKFLNLDNRFLERDRRFELQHTSNKELLNEQRSSSEKAINKAEQATAAELSNQRAFYADLKERLQAQEMSLTNRINAIENKAIGASSLWAVIVSGFVVTSIVVAVVAAIIGMAIQ